MTEKEQALERLANAEREIAECKAILNKPEEKQETAEQWLRGIWGEALYNIKKSHDDCPTFYIGNDWCFQQDRKNGELVYSYYRVWTVLNSQFKMQKIEINKLVKDVVGEVLNCEGLTPYHHPSRPMCKGGRGIKLRGVDNTIE